MVVGQRIFRLAYLIDAATRKRLLTENHFAALRASLEQHFALLASPGFFAARHNHGVYQALGHLAAATRLHHVDDGLEQHRQLALSNLQLVVSNQFSKEGVHLEHSPFYHGLVTAMLLRGVQTGLVPAEFRPLTDRAIEVARWLSAPDGSPPSFGDTPFGGRLPTSVLNEIGDAPRPEGVKIYPLGGYGFIRLREGDQESYVAMLAGFHSRVHKHADHLTFAWSEGPRNIIVDPGRVPFRERSLAGSEARAKGYWYADEDRNFVESTGSHSCLQAGSDDHDRIGVRPFGCLGLDGGAADDLAWLAGRAQLSPSIVQERTLVLFPGRFLLVRDEATADAALEWRQRFVLAPRWIPSGPLSFSLDGRKLHVTPLEGATKIEVVTGATLPEREGWVAIDGTLEPTTAIRIGTAGDRASFLTLFSLAGEPRDVRVTRAGDAVVAAWTDDRGGALCPVPAPARQIDL
jgi:hypothetical protein